jgi:hypothetical protein
MNDIKWADVLGPLASTFAPVLGGLIAGPAGAAVGGVLGKALASAMGVDATPEAVREAVQADPAKAEETIRALGLDPALVATLGSVEALELARERIAAEDRAGARAQTMTLASNGSPIAWGAPVVSTLVVAGFLAMVAALLFRTIPDTAVTNILLGTLAAAFVQVVNYWLGSSAGSKTKDTTIRAIAEDRAEPAPRGDRFSNLRPPSVGTLQ